MFREEAIARSDGGIDFQVVISMAYGAGRNANFI